ncbi:hypothetical protein PO461_23645 [Enterobacter asburiae]|uniref:hypothetical protein n=1 Tax=Enterobacter asburiae TaxID=61645 RepID=UPI002FF63AA0
MFPDPDKAQATLPDALALQVSILRQQASQEYCQAEGTLIAMISSLGAQVLMSRHTGISRL